MIKQISYKYFIFLILFLASFTFISAGELRVTQEHPFLINGSWIDASELKVGDELTLSNGSKVKITKLTDVETENLFKVYNLEAGNYHNFVVGEKGVVVHNSNGAFGGQGGSVLNPFSKENWKPLLSRFKKKVPASLPVSDLFDPIAGQASFESAALNSPNSFWARSYNGIKSKRFIDGAIAEVGSRGKGETSGYFDMILSDGTSVVAFRPLSSSRFVPVDIYKTSRFLEIMESNPSTRGVFPKYLGMARDEQGLYYLVLERFPRNTRMFSSYIDSLSPEISLQMQEIFTPQMYSMFKAEGLNLQRGIETDYFFVVDGKFKYGVSVRAGDFIEQASSDPIFNMEPQYKTALQNILE